MTYQAMLECAGVHVTKDEIITILQKIIIIS